MKKDLCPKLSYKFHKSDVKCPQIVSVIKHIMETSHRNFDDYQILSSSKSSSTKPIARNIPSTLFLGIIADHFPSRRRHRHHEYYDLQLYQNEHAK